MSQRISGYSRQANETYETPSWVTLIAADYLRDCRVTHVWDPADGPHSKLANALRAEGFCVTTTSDCFLSKTAPPDNRITCVTSNPPYGFGGRVACAFIAHAIRLVPITVMLLRADFDSAKTRAHLFGNCPAFAGKIVLTSRIAWFEPVVAAPSENHAWFCWNWQQVGPPTIAYARRDMITAGHHG